MLSKKLVGTKHNAKTKILSMSGYIHRITEGLAEIITYLSQLMPFEEASRTFYRVFKYTTLLYNRYYKLI